MKELYARFYNVVNTDFGSSPVHTSAVTTVYGYRIVRLDRFTNSRKAFLDVSNGYYNNTNEEKSTIFIRKPFLFKRVLFI